MAPFCRVGPLLSPIASSNEDEDHTVSFVTRPSIDKADKLTPTDLTLTFS